MNTFVVVHFIDMSQMHGMSGFFVSPCTFLPCGLFELSYERVRHVLENRCHLKSPRLLLASNFEAKSKRGLLYLSSA